MSQYETLNRIISGCGELISRGYVFPNILIMSHDIYFGLQAEMNTTTGVTTYQRLKDMINTDGQPMFKLFIRVDILPRIIVAGGNI